MPPIVALLMMTGLAQVLSIEQALGVTAGHEATTSFVDRLIGRLEPATSSEVVAGREPASPGDAQLSL